MYIRGFSFDLYINIYISSVNRRFRSLLLFKCILVFLFSSKLFISYNINDEMNKWMMWRTRWNQNRFSIDWIPVTQMFLIYFFFFLSCFIVIFYFSKCYLLQKYFIATDWSLYILKTTFVDVDDTYKKIQAFKRSIYRAKWNQHWQKETNTKKVNPKILTPFNISAPQSLTFNNIYIKKKMWIMFWFVSTVKSIWQQQQQNCVVDFLRRHYYSTLSVQWKEKKSTYKFKWQDKASEQVRGRETTEKKNHRQRSHTHSKRFCLQLINPQIAYTSFKRRAHSFERKKMSINKMKRR